MATVVQPHRTRHALGQHLATVVRAKGIAELHHSTVVQVVWHSLANAPKRLISSIPTRYVARKMVAYCYVWIVRTDPAAVHLDIVEVRTTTADLAVSHSLGSVLVPIRQRRALLSHNCTRPALLLPQGPV